MNQLLRIQFEGLKSRYRRKLIQRFLNHFFQSQKYQAFWRISEAYQKTEVFLTLNQPDKTQSYVFVISGQSQKNWISLCGETGLSYKLMHENPAFDSAASADNPTAQKSNQLLNDLKSAIEKISTIIAGYGDVFSYSTQQMNSLPELVNYKHEYDFNLAAYYMLQLQANSRPVRRKVHRLIHDRLITSNSLTYIEIYDSLVNFCGNPADEIEIFQLWQDFARKEKNGNLMIYIHIPFCAKICNFCSCLTIEFSGKNQIRRYVDQLCSDLEKFGKILKKIPVPFVYFGGGTPSMLSEMELIKILDTLEQNFNLKPGRIITFEANPDSLTEKKIHILNRNNQLNRLTLGIQTVDENAQKHANRYNQYAKIENLVSFCRSLGIPLISVDIITGLDGLSYKAFKKDLNLTIKLQPDLISVDTFRPFQFHQLHNIEIEDSQALLRKKQNDWARKLFRRLKYSQNTAYFSKNPRQHTEGQTLYANIFSAMLGVGSGASAHIPGLGFYNASENDANFYSSGNSKYLLQVTNASDELADRILKVIYNNHAQGKISLNVNEQYLLKQLLSLKSRKILETLGIHVNEGEIIFSFTNETARIVSVYFLLPDKIRNLFQQNFHMSYERRENYLGALIHLYDAEFLATLI